MLRTKLTAAVATGAVLVALCACGNAPAGSQGKATASAPAQQTKTVQIKKSPDKYTHYVKNYVGMNAANVGYMAMDGRRHDEYGNGVHPVIVFVTPDGTHIDSSDSESKLLRKYRVSNQNVAPNTKIKSTFDKDEDGTEYDNLTTWNSIDEIVLAVDEVGKSGNSTDMTKIKASPNNTTAYIRDYVGRNLADCGYVSLTGKFVDGYVGGSYVQLDVNASDGSYVDVSDSKSLSQYRVTAQSVEPNTELTFEHEKDEDGTEYENLAINQSISSITLSVEKISK